MGRPCAQAQEACMHPKVLVRVSAVVGCIATCTVSTTSAANTVSDWNVIAVQGAAAAGQNAIVASRTLAIAQIAVHDALNAIDARYQRYARLQRGQGDRRAEQRDADCRAEHDRAILVRRIARGLEPD